MKPSLVSFISVHVVVASALLAQKPTSTFDLSCISSLELPTRGLLAARAETSGTVFVIVDIGEDGRPSRITLTGDNRMLKAEVRVAIKQSIFAPDCRGRAMEFIFAFTLEDPPTDYVSPPLVRFKPPNRFDLVFRRAKRNIELPPPPAPDAK